MRTRLGLVLTLLAGCMADVATPDTVPHDSPKIPIAGYLNGDATAERAWPMLQTHGIEAYVVCSLGCTVGVDAARADEARALLRAANLGVDVID